MYTKSQQLSKNKKPKPSMKNKPKYKPLDLMDKSEVVRFDSRELANRVDFVMSKKICQVCEISEDLDYPHHARYGWSRKDDRFLICICVNCHRLIHNVGFSRVKKTREQTEEIAWNNHLEYMNGK